MAALDEFEIPITPIALDDGDGGEGGEGLLEGEVDDDV